MGELQPGAVVLGRYRLEREVARGGMGAVYLAVDPVLERRVALKVLLPGLADAELCRRAEREARVMAKVNHPNVVSILDAGTHEGQPVIAMEWLEGQTLGGILDRGALTWQSACALLTQICLGLEALHRVGVIHRDLKPANVMVLGGATRHAKLLDLGLARPIEVQPGKDGLTQAQMIIGTPAYMPMEQLFGRALTSGSDLFSLGVVAFECVTGRLPWADVSYGGALSRANQLAPTAAAPAGFPVLPVQLVELIASLLAPAASARPASALGVARVLHGLARAESVVVPQPAGRQPMAAAVARAAPVSSGSEPTLLRGAPAPGMLPGSDPTLLRAATPPVAVAPAPPTELPEGRAGQMSVRSVLVARLPASRLSRPLVRKGLGGLVDGRGRSFTLGESVWLATLVGVDDQVELARAEQIAARLREEFGDHTPVSTGLVPESFALTTAALSGQTRLPEPLGAMLAALEG